MGRSLSKEAILPTWVERYVGLTFRQSQKRKPLGCCLDVGVGVQLKKVKVTNFLYRAVSLPQNNVSTYKVSPCNLCCAASFGT